VTARIRRRVLSWLPLTLLRESFVLFIATQGILVAVVHFAGLGTPGSITRSLPPWLVAAWSGWVLIGCVAVVAGLIWSYPRLEVAGLRLMAPCQLIYCAAIVLAAGWGGLGAAAPQLLFAVACGGRALWLTEYMRALQVGLDAARQHQGDKPCKPETG
jgi:hypothetical protein